MRLNPAHRIPAFVLTLAVMATLLAIGGVASSGIVPKPIVAGPGATIAGYATANVTIKKGAKATFYNLDIAPHNVKSNAGLFYSGPPIGLGKSAPVTGVSKLNVGKYGFYCTLHPNMKGTLTVKK